MNTCKYAMRQLYTGTYRDTYVGVPYEIHEDTLKTVCWRFPDMTKYFVTFLQKMLLGAKLQRQISKAIYHLQIMQDQCSEKKS